MMWGDEEIRDIPQWRIFREWLLIENIKSCADDDIVFQSIDEVGFIYNLATGYIDKDC